MTEPGEKEEGVQGVAQPPVVVNYANVDLSKIRTTRLAELHKKEGLDFPVDADASSKIGGRAVAVRQDTDKIT